MLFEFILLVVMLTVVFGVWQDYRQKEAEFQEEEKELARQYSDWKKHSSDKFN